ncbi:uncharacterized protein [Ptychodera flava]|uniref:uncharacterized protein n=1 Tax=Ptychodera flava TaxID=63121 RepID=UPI00396A9D40
MDRSPITGVDFGSVHPKYGYIPRSLKLRDEFTEQRIAVLENRSLSDTHRHYTGWKRHDGKGDAFRHALWSYRMTREYGTEIARRYGEEAVRKDNLPTGKQSMDLYNQEQGRRLGQTQFFGNEYAQERPAFDYVDDRFREYFSYRVGRQFIEERNSQDDYAISLIKGSTEEGRLQTRPYRRPKTSMF